MSHFTEFQIRRFSFIFEQYAVDAKVKAAQSSRKTAAPQDFVLPSRLTVPGLVELLKRLGPSVTADFAKDLIYKYDSSCTGSLEFEDCLELLADYQDTLSNKRNEAMEYYESQLNSREYEAEAFISSFPILENYISHLGLDDPEGFFDQEEELTQRILNQGYVVDPCFLKRTIVVRIFGAQNVKHLARLKQRDGRFIDFQSLDPVVQVSCTGIVKETTVLLGSIKPEWSQDLVFNVHIPPGEVHDVQAWVDKQSIVFHLSDYVASGLIPHGELLAFGSVSLSRVLMTTRKPFTTIIKMTSPDCSFSDIDTPRLEVSFSDITHENWSWAKVVDAYLHPEEVWSRLYPKKLRRDLETYALAPSKTSDEAKKETDTSKGGIWDHYTAVMASLHNVFRRRSFHAVAIDEMNTFRFLPALVRPIETEDPRLEAFEDFASAISTIPYNVRDVPKSDLTKFLQFTYQYQKNGAGFDSLPSSFIATWKLRANPSEFLSENFHAQIASPSTMIARREGTLMEHAIALCSMLVGRGANAFVAIGTIKRRCYIWVIEISANTEEEAPIEKRGRVADTGDDIHDIQHYDTFIYTSIVEGEEDSDFFRKGDFEKRELVKDVVEKNKKFVVTHYDLVTGTSFTAKTGSKFPFDRISTVFNHKNIWFNVQYSDLIQHSLFSWDLKNGDCWFPFLGKRTPITPGNIHCFYADPYFMNHFEFKLDYVRMDEPSILKSLVRMIQLYRQHHLFVTETRFHREICKLIQSFMLQIEDPSVLRPAQGTTGARRGSRVLSKSVLGSTITFAADMSWETPVDSSAIRRLKDRITGLLPDRHYWQGSIFTFVDTSLPDIMEQLILSGILDCAVPNSIYTLGCKVVKRPFGMTSVRIVVGYLVDILGTEAGT